MNLIEQLRTLDPRDRRPLAAARCAASSCCSSSSSARAFAWYMFVWNDDRPVLQKAEADELDLRSQFENKQQRAANLDAYKAQLGGNGAQLRRHAAAVARQDRGAEPAGRHFPDRPRGGPAGEAVPARRASRRKGFYAELPIKIRLVGTYHEFGNFVSGIAALPRIVTLRRHSDHARRTTRRGYDNLTMDLTAKTYRYIEDEGAGAHATAKKKPGGAT